MTQRNNGGPAFPGQKPPEFWGDAPEGMSMRDYFAAKAMQGLLANPGGPIQENPQCGWGYTNCNTPDVAASAYYIADAMLTERGSSQ